MNLEHGLYLRPLSPETRAEHLLRQHLSPAQLRDYSAEERFWAVGNISAVRYLILKANGSNILIEGMHSLCVGPPYPLQLPLADRVLAQKLYIELAEDRLLSPFGFTPLGLKEDLARRKLYHL